jgi:hypothetical protein
MRGFLSFWIFISRYKLFQNFMTQKRCPERRKIRSLSILSMKQAKSMKRCIFQKLIVAQMIEKLPEFIEREYQYRVENGPPLGFMPNCINPVCLSSILIL